MSQKDAPAASYTNEELESKAFEIYKDLGGRPGYTTESLVVESFRRAKQFLDVSGKIRSGALSTEKAKEEVRYVKVPRVRMKDGGQFDVVTNDVGEPVMEELPTDSAAFAPNLPANHPVNLRFAPTDGSTFEQLRAQALSGLKGRKPSSVN